MIYEQRYDFGIVLEGTSSLLNFYIMIKYTLESFINKANLKHDNKYDYSKLVYINGHTKSVIICPTHGEFIIEPRNHLKFGCFHCRIKSPVQYHKFEEYLKKFKYIHNNIYNYDKFDYKGYAHKGIIICHKHGEFQCNVGNHLKGKGCPKCKQSHGERKIINWCKDNNIEFEEQKRFNDCRDKQPLPFDFYIESHNLLIEYQGVQHFKQVARFKNTNLEKRKIIDNLKKNYALSNNYNFLEITYKDNINEKLNNTFSF